MNINGRTIALSVAGLLVAAASVANAGDKKPADDKSKEAKVMCEGINSCKGTGSCGSAKGNQCAGTNECKGKGWLSVTAKECKDKNGKVLEKPVMKTPAAPAPAPAAPAKPAEKTK
jgi:hypothetical protein